MNQAYFKLISLVKKIRLTVIVSVLVETLALFAGISTAIILVYVFLDYFVNFARNLRSFLFPILTFLFFIFLLLLIFLKLSINWKKEKIALLIGKVYPNLKDNFINALQLGAKKKSYFSEELVAALIEQVSRKTEIVKPFPVFSALTVRLREYLFFTFSSFLVLLVTYTLFPKVYIYSLPRLFLVEYTPVIKVIPGNFSLPRGNNLEIIAEIGEVMTAKEKPLLLYRYEKGKWNKNLMSIKESTPSRLTKYNFLFSSVLENLEYRINWGKLSSPLYQVKVISPPEIGDFSFEYHYPSYTQLPAEKVEKTNGDISTLLGTRVYLKAKVNKPLKKATLVFADGQMKELKYGKNTVQGEILISKENTYWFELSDEDGYLSQDSIKYKIEIKPDEFPKIEFLSPKEDLIVSEKGKLKLTYLASDDFGLKQVTLFYHRQNEKDWSVLDVTLFPPGTKEKIDDFDWNLAEFSFLPGETIEYYLQISDNDTISGPKKSSSEILKIEIFSYEREHREIEKNLYSFQENLLELLAQQIEAQKLSDKIEKLREVSTSPAEQLLPWTELENQQKKIAEKTAENIKNLNEQLERMKNDPLTTQRTYEEYSGLKDNLEYLQQKPMQEIFTPIKEKNLPETKNKQEEIVSNLEKMSLLSEDILDYQRMYNLLTHTQELNELSADLTTNLEKMSSLDEKSIKEFNETIDKIAKLFDKVQELLTKMPQELPEEFVNQPQVKEINLGQTEDLFSQLKQALAQGNLQSALEYAKSLAQNLAKILETLQQAAQTSAYSEMDKLSQELEKHTRELDNLIEEENKEVAKTTKYEQKRLDKLLQFQDRLLEELARRQKKVIENTRNLEKSAGFSWSVANVLPKMEKVYAEFNEKKVQDAVKLLGEIISELKNLGSLIRNIFNAQNTEYANWQKKHEESRTKGEKPAGDFLQQGQKLKEQIDNLPRIIDATKNIEDEETAILDLLKKNSKPDSSEFFSKPEKDEIQNLGKKQDELADRTRKLNLQLQTLGQKSALLGPELSQNLRNAQKSMQDGENNLNQYSTGEALDNEKDALYWLNQGKEGISQAIQKLAGGEKKVSQPVAGFIQHPASGPLGIKIGYVKLPGAEEYKPPKEFREELLEALKEKYPKLYEELIKQYYKRLTE
jgi:DNA repair exonuclease SbcCD ATPase subunit